MRLAHASVQGQKKGLALAHACMLRVRVKPTVKVRACMYVICVRAKTRFRASTCIHVIRVRRVKVSTCIHVLRVRAKARVKVKGNGGSELFFASEGVGKSV